MLKDPNDWFATNEVPKKTWISLCAFHTVYIESLLSAMWSEEVDEVISVRGVVKPLKGMRFTKALRLMVFILES